VGVEVEVEVEGKELGTALAGAEGTTWN